MGAGRRSLRGSTGDDCCPDQSRGGILKGAMETRTEPGAMAGYDRLIRVKMTRSAGDPAGSGLIYVQIFVFRDNPLKYTDPDGRETVIFSIPVTPFDRHLFIAVRGEEGNITTRGLYPDNQLKAVIDSITIIGVQESKVLTDKANELEHAKNYFSNPEQKLKGGAKFEAKIQTPEGLSEEAFDNIVLENADNYSTKERPYNAKWGPNSNTFVDDVIEKSGGEIPDIPKATQQNWGE
jgi:hypothetical protein